MSSRVLHTLTKPPGLSVLPLHGDQESDCLVRRLYQTEPRRVSQDWPTGFPAGVAHRLDISTSGAVAVADDPADLRTIRAAFSSGALTKTYLLWASRDVPWHTHVCDRPIAHARRHRGRMVVRRSESTPHRGRWYAAHTKFERVEGRLWRATMTTGVMHQIRVHAGFLGIAILGDRRYGGGQTPEFAPEHLTFYLHHVGFHGAGLQTAPVPEPAWVRAARHGVEGQ